MIARPPVPLLIAAMLAMPLGGCDNPPSERDPAAGRDPAPAFRNEAASQSIMQEDVIAATENVVEPAPPLEPPALPKRTIGFERWAALDDAGRAALDSLLADTAVPVDARFVLRGHSDAMGSDRDNLVTSRRRAMAVRAYLLDHDVAPDRIEVIALGERRPVAPNATRDGADDPAGRARNRRVDVEVLAPVAAPAAATDEGAVAPATPSAGAERDGNSSR